MLEKDFENKIEEYVNELGIKLSKNQIEMFFKYMNLLLEWNKKINLTAITDEEEVIVKHFVDSITISKYIPTGTSLIDVGTGAGFPGIPLGIIRKDLEIVLLDSLQKRINFLDVVIKELGLENIKTIHARVEEFGKSNKYREKFDVATSRAVANLSTLSEYLLPLVKEGGIVICMKGSVIDEELNNSKKAINVLGGKTAQVFDFYLPKTDIKRNIVLIDKVSKTPAKYPRKPGTPSKEPISWNINKRRKKEDIILYKKTL